jgi:hypothetical protein
MAEVLINPYEGKCILLQHIHFIMVWEWGKTDDFRLPPVLEFWKIFQYLVGIFVADCSGKDLLSYFTHEPI